MIELVVLGERWNTDDTEELKFGWQALKRQLPPSACIVKTTARNAEDLWREAQRAATLHASKLRAYDTEAQVLVLAHPHLAMAPSCLSTLTDNLHALNNAMGNKQNICWAYDSQHTPNNVRVSYFTWRGLERFAEKLPTKKPSQLAHPNQALASVIVLDTLLQLTDFSALLHWGVSDAFIHDYANYRSGQRLTLMHIVPSSARKVLDVGGGEGGFLEAIKQRQVCETHLAEHSVQACAVAQSRVDKVWQGDFCTTPIDATFDCISFLDVLEHTPDPLSWLQRARELLSPEGVVITSIPNVGHWSVVADLLEGRWDYAPVGIHCITHLRFFTRHGIEDLFAQAGFAIDCIEATVVPPPPWWNLAGLQDATSNMLDIQADKLNAYAYAVRARVI